MTENSEEKEVQNDAGNRQSQTLRLVKKFFFPTLNHQYFIRLAVVASIAFLFFYYFCIPLRIKGKSMEPTYHDRTINFCWCPTYWFSEPKRYDVVCIRFAGNSVMLLKRIVALEGETVEFRKGKLYVNGKPVDELYVKNPCDWDLEPRLVEKGRVYVVGDNRDIAIELHKMGRVNKERIVGVPIW